MWIRTGRTPATRLAIYVNLLQIWIYIFTVEISARTYEKRNFSKNNDTSVGKDGFAQKKPRSAQYAGFIPRLQAVYPRQSVPVRLTAIPVNGGYRLPITQRLSNVAPLTRSLPRTYVPIIGSVPSIRYPMLRQGGLSAPRYVVPYQLKMPAQGLPQLPSPSQISDNLGKHYNEKYNTLPTISNVGLTDDSMDFPRKTENKKLDIGDEFDNFLENLGEQVF